MFAKVQYTIDLPLSKNNDLSRNSHKTEKIVAWRSLMIFFYYRLCVLQTLRSSAHDSKPFLWKVACLVEAWVCDKNVSIWALYLKHNIETQFLQLI